MNPNLNFHVVKVFYKCIRTLQAGRRVWAKPRIQTEKGLCPQGREDFILVRWLHIV